MITESFYTYIESGFFPQSRHVEQLQDKPLESTFCASHFYSLQHKSTRLQQKNDK